MNSQVIYAKSFDDAIKYLELVHQGQCKWEVKEIHNPIQKKDQE
jgi:hypothetical protein